jgi:hypothetical protein
MQPIFGRFFLVAFFFFAGFFFAAFFFFAIKPPVV